MRLRDRGVPRREEQALEQVLEQTHSAAALASGATPALVHGACGLPDCRCRPAFCFCSCDSCLLLRRWPMRIRQAKIRRAISPTSLGRTRLEPKQRNAGRSSCLLSFANQFSLRRAARPNGPPHRREQKGRSTGKPFSPVRMRRSCIWCSGWSGGVQFARCCRVLTACSAQELVYLRKPAQLGDKTIKTAKNKRRSAVEP